MKKLSNLKWFTLGIVVCLVVSIFVVPALAAFTKTAELYYDNIKITLNGETLTPKDVNGKVVEPFIIDGTTYLPVRAIGESLGLGVDWDSATSTAILTGSASPGDKIHEAQVCGAYYELYKIKDDLSKIYKDIFVYIATYFSISGVSEGLTNMYNSICGQIKSGCNLEKRISAVENSVNALSGDRWVKEEAWKLTASVKSANRALGDLRLLVDEIPEIENSGKITSEFWNQDRYISDYFRRDDLTINMDKAFAKLVSASTNQ